LRFASLQITHMMKDEQPKKLRSDPQFVGQLFKMADRQNLRLEQKFMFFNLLLTF